MLYCLHGLGSLCYHPNRNNMKATRHLKYSNNCLGVYKVLKVDRNMKFAIISIACFNNCLGVCYHQKYEIAIISRQQFEACNNCSGLCYQ